MRIVIIAYRYNFSELSMRRFLLCAALALTAQMGFAQDAQFTLTIKDHTFSPKELTVPAGQKFKLVVVNQDKTTAEFESKSLGREKLIPGGKSITVNLGPLKPGRYEFVEEFHEREPGAQGTLIVQ